MIKLTEEENNTNVMAYSQKEDLVDSPYSKDKDVGQNNSIYTFLTLTSDVVTDAHSFKTYGGLCDYLKYDPEIAKSVKSSHDLDKLLRDFHFSDVDHDKNYRIIKNPLDD